MSQAPKIRAFPILLSLAVVLVSVIFLWTVIKHDMSGHHHADGYDHETMHGTGPMVMGAYARANGASAKAGAVFFAIKNHSDDDDMLIGAETSVANRAELHTHIETDGVMQMREIEGGIKLEAHGLTELKRGGDHVMLMGLKQSLNHGDVITLTLTFEKSDPIVLEVPVDLERKPDHGGSHEGH